MPIIAVWECPKTKKIFTDAKKYKKHLRVLARANLTKKRTERNVREFMSLVGELKRSVVTVEELECAITMNIQKLVDYHSSKSWGNAGRVAPTIIDFRIKFHLDFNNNVSNSHSCPRNGVTNFGRKSGAPTGYPGLVGRMEFSYTSVGNNEIPSWVSDMYKILDINTGSGGGGRTKQGDTSVYSGRYEARIFQDDWPELLYDYVAADTLQRLS